VVKNIKSGLFDTFGDGMLLDSTVVVRHRFPNVADASITKIVRNLTSSEEEQLTELSRRRRDDIFDRFNNIEQRVLEIQKVTGSHILAFTICSACSSSLRSIRGGFPFHILHESAVRGFVCINEKCEFCAKLIPLRKVAELTNVIFLTSALFAAEDFVKEHPEFLLEVLNAYPNEYVTYVPRRK